MRRSLLLASLLLTPAAMARADEHTAAAPTVTAVSVTTVPSAHPPAGARPADPPATAPAPSGSGPSKPPADPAPGAPPSETTPKLPPFEPGIELRPKSPGEKVAFSLEDADLSELLRVVGEITGRRFVVATGKIKSFKATVFSPQKITVAEAYQAFLSILQANQLTVIPSGAFWKIVDTQDVTRQATPIARSGDATTSEERYVTRIQRLAHVNAEEVATTVLAKFQTHDGSVVPYAPGNLLIITDTGENIRRMQRILEEIDVGAATDKVWLEPLFYVSSADVEKKLADVFDLKSAKDGKPTPQGAGDYRLTKIVALDRPNALVLVGSEGAYARALAFLKRIDVPVASEGDIHVVPLQYADAKKIVPALTEAVQGAGAAAAQGSRPGAQPIAVLDSPVKISAEETTNAILVTSTERDFAAVREVIAKLDQPRRQVYIEAVVMDLRMQDTTGFGVKYHGISPNDDGSAVYGGLDAITSIGGPIGIAASSKEELQGLALGIVGPQFTALGMTVPAFGALLEARATSQDSDILQTPHILATDNTKAEIYSQLNTSLQQNAPTLSVGGTGATGALSALSALPMAGAAISNYGKIGPKITITPHLNDSDEVRLDVQEVFSDVVDGKPQGTLGTISFLERGANTTLTVKDEQTVMIGGLVRDVTQRSTSKIPVLGDIPLIGALFRSTTDVKEKSNLVLILTPHIIRDQEDLRRIYERKMEERQDFVDHQRLFDDHAKWEPTRDYARARGLLEEIRQSDLRVDEQRKNAALLQRPATKTHTPTEPLDLPVENVRAPASQTSTTPTAGAPLHPAATVERVER